MENVEHEDLGKKPSPRTSIGQGPVPKLNPWSYGVWIASTRFSWDFSRTSGGWSQKCLDLWSSIRQISGAAARGCVRL